MLNATILAVTANAVCDMPLAGMALYVQTARSRGAVGYFGSPAHGRGTRSRYPRPHLLRYKNEWPQRCFGQKQLLVVVDVQWPIHWYSTSGRPALPYRERRTTMAESARCSR